MPIRKKIDVNTKNAIAYMQESACSRGAKNVSTPFFAYAIMRACHEYIEQYVPPDNLGAAADQIGESLPEGSDRIHLEELTYSRSILDYVNKVESEDLPGVIAILLDIVANNDSIKKIFDDNEVYSYDLERASKFEKARHNSGRRKRNNANKSGPLDDMTSRVMPVQQRAHKSDLASFCTDLTALAKDGKIGDVFCRDYEISKTITALLRKVKSNPLLIGEPGVGKTAVVEGLAAKIVNGEVPAKLKNCTVMSLDVSSVVGGTTLRGEFEERMKAIMVELTSRKDIILFIDEIHMLVGAGDHTGSMDAGNILKPYLARGDIKCIGATTHYEYNKHMKKDGALVRRFQRLTINELSEEQTLDIMQGLVPSFEDFHGVKVSSDAIKAIVKLSSKHIVDRYLPDKAIDCLDEACARAVILDHDVCRNIVEEAMADLASIPVSIIRQNSFEMRKIMVGDMKSSILGNDSAIDDICNAVASRTSSVSISDRPLCSMVLQGPKGVGKKSCIRMAAKGMFGSRDSIVEIEGSDYSEQYSISKIIGSPPGYVGYSEEGVLKEVKRKPHSIVMITGFNLMHPAVREQMIKVVRNGKINDSEGNVIDFRSATVVFVADTDTKSNTLGFAKSTSRAVLDKSIWKDILDDVDAIVEFDEVAEKSVMNKVVKLEINLISQAYADSGSVIAIEKDDVKEMFDDLFPCSPSEMRRKIRKRIEMKLMSEKMSNKES